MTNFTLAPFAVDEKKSRGRLFRETYDDSKYRSVFGRDRDRIINSSAFRRLQYKTQVFVNHQGDHYRTRLTHSLEVAQIARWIAGALCVNKDLAEIVSLAHDLGHTPFGHAGEEALNQKMQGFGGFSHNAHTLKIITQLETRFIEFEGLNLSWEMLEGVVKHNGAITDESRLHGYIAEYNQRHDLDLKNSPSLEAQISAIADDIAYNNHDLEDGLRAGLFEVEELFELPLIGKIYQEIHDHHSLKISCDDGGISNDAGRRSCDLKNKFYPKIKRELLVGEAKKNITLAMVIDVIDSTKQNLEKNKIDSEKKLRECGKFLVNFSDEFELAHQTLKKFLMEKMYRHHTVNRMTANAKKVVGGLFDFYLKNPNCLPDGYDVIAAKISDQKQLAILISDYIAGMTDRFAIHEFEELL